MFPLGRYVRCALFASTLLTQWQMADRLRLTARSSIEKLPIEMNHLILKKWLSKQAFRYEHDEDFRKIRGKKCEEVNKIRLKVNATKNSSRKCPKVPIDV